MTLQHIFEAITPDNIKEIPLVKTAMGIFIEILEENCKISQNIRKIYEDENEHIRIALIETYIKSLYNVLSKAQDNPVLIKKLLSNDPDSKFPLSNELYKMFNVEDIITNKAFKQKVGTEVSIKYAYNIAKYFSGGGTEDDFILEELKPFHFKTTGSVLKEMYETVVRPLSHPLGFTYMYNQVIKQIINDFYGIEFVYNFKKIEVRCSLNSSYQIFTSENNDINVKKDFLSRVNLKTGKLFTEEEYYQYVTVITDKVVSEYTDITVDNKNYRSILFTDGTYLEQSTNPINVNYMYYSDYINNDYSNLIQDYTDHCSLYLDFDIVHNFTYSDNIDRMYEEFNITNIKENTSGNVGGQYYSIKIDSNAFNVGGDTYEFVPGIDESILKYNNYDLLREEIENKYTVTVNGISDIYDYINITISDELSELTHTVIPNLDSTFNSDFNICEFKGDEYKLSASIYESSIEYNAYIISNGLNNFDKKVSIDSFTYISNTVYKLLGYGIPSCRINIKLLDSNNRILNINTYTTSDGLINLNLNVSNLESGEYELYLTLFEDDYEEKEYHTYIKGNNFKFPIDVSKISLQPIKYKNGAPDFSGLLSYSEINSTSDMAGFDSTTSLIKFKIGELADNVSYANPNISVLDYIQLNNLSNISEIPSNILIDDAYIEGVDYNKCFSSDLVSEKCFIDYGRDIYPISTSDIIIMTSEDYCNDNFQSFIISDSGYYLYTDDGLVGYDFYLFTKDHFYLSTLGDE